MIHRPLLDRCVVEQRQFVASAKKVIKQVEEHFCCRILHNQADGKSVFQFDDSALQGEQDAIVEDIIGTLGSAGIDIGEVCNMLEIPSPLDDNDDNELEALVVEHPTFHVVLYMKGGGGTGLYFDCAANKQDAKATDKELIAPDYPAN